MPPFPTLETERLVLRELRYADAPALLAERGDATVMQYMGTNPIKDLEEANSMISRIAAARVAAAPAFRWVLERKSDGIFLGTCGVFNWDEQWEKCVLGYDLSSFAWRQGYMREALPVILGWAFQHMSLHRIEALIHPDNAASLKLASRFGFVLEGRLREVAHWSGNHHDMLMLGLLKSDFNPQLQLQPIS